MISSRIICAIFSSYALLGFSTHSLAWGSDGHGTIGILAMSQLRPDARLELESIVGPLDEQAMLEACNWPDVIRETEEWAWTTPQHYVNIPRGDFTYLESRDCPQQQCVTEAIKQYASELADHETGKEKRRQSFAWICHLVGDLHQPLHAGFGDDRGGNDFDVVFNGEQMNLHRFWDSGLINQHAGSWQNLVGLMSTTPRAQAGANWSPGMVNDWTNGSHKLVVEALYPEPVNIDKTYEKQSWELVQKQINSAATHLALIINSVLAKGN